MNPGEQLICAAFEGMSDAERIAAVSADPRGASAVLIALGDECERFAAGAPEKALALGNDIARVADILGARSASARALRATIPAFAYLGKLDEALVRAALAQTEADRAHDVVEHARAAVASLHALAKLGRTDEALARGSAARNALLEAKRPELAARAELNLANIHKMRGENSEALAALERALAGIPAEESAARGTIENTCGETLLQLDRFQDAAGAFDRAEPLLAALPLAQAIVIGNRADLHAREGRIGDALRGFDRAAHIARDLAPGHYARLLVEQAEALALVGAHRESLEAVDSALLTAEAKGLRAESARGLLVRARTLAAAGRLSESSDAASRSLSISREIGDTRMARAAALVASELALDRGDADRAIEFARNAAQGAGALDSARASVREARARLLAGDAPDALRCAMQSLDTASALGVGVVEIDASLAAADCQRVLGKLDASITLLSRAMELAEGIRSTLAADQYRSAFSTSRIRVYEDLALDLLARGDPDSIQKAFIAAERARSRLLLDTLLRVIDRTSAVDHGDSLGFTPALLELRARLSALHTSTSVDESSTGERIGLAPNLVHEIQAVERDIDALLTRRQTERGIGALLAHPLPTEAVLAALETGDALIAYFASGDELLAFVGYAGQLSCVRALVNISDLEPLVEKFLFQLRAGVRDGDQEKEPRAIHAMARVLHDLLVAPIFVERQDAAAAQRLVVIPFGVLHALPFAALSDGSRHLIERFEIQTAPSATLACRAVTDMPRAPKDMLVVGFADEHAPLITDEVRAIAAISASVVLTGSAAQRSAVRDAVRPARVVHLACHGRFVPALPAASGLRLADGWMPMRDLMQLELNADLVFLSGCETGCHAVDVGEELSGIARAVLAAGARRLVTTLWSVRDAAAIDIATHFHTSFAAGIRPSSALRDAMVASMQKTPHPSWWAPFVVSGVL